MGDSLVVYLLYVVHMTIHQSQVLVPGSLPHNWINPVTQRLRLPRKMRIHPVFHVLLLRPHKENSFPGCIPTPQLPVQVQGQEEFLVHHILDSKRIGGNCIIR